MRTVPPRSRPTPKAQWPPTAQTATGIRVVCTLVALHSHAYMYACACVDKCFIAHACITHNIYKRLGIHINRHVPTDNRPIIRSVRRPLSVIQPREGARCACEHRCTALRVSDSRAPNMPCNVSSHTLHIVPLSSLVAIAVISFWCHAPEQASEANGFPTHSQTDAVRTIPRCNRSRL